MRQQQADKQHPEDLFDKYCPLCSLTLYIPGLRASGITLQCCLLDMKQLVVD